MSELAAGSASGWPQDKSVQTVVLITTVVLVKY